MLVLHVEFSTQLGSKELQFFKKSMNIQLCWTPEEGSFHLSGCNPGRHFANCEKGSQDQMSSTVIISKGPQRACLHKGLAVPVSTDAAAPVRELFLGNLFLNLKRVSLQKV